MGEQIHEYADTVRTFEVDEESIQRQAEVLEEVRRGWESSDRSMGSHHSAKSKTNTWLTPPDVIEKLGPFDLDPCAAPSPRPWPTAERHIELPEDGYAADWGDEFVWMNPPYSTAEVTLWMRKLADHGNGLALVYARTETAWFIESVWGRADAVLFVHGRYHFHYTDGTRATANSGAPSVIVAYGDLAIDRLLESGIEGTFAIRRPGNDGWMFK